MPSPSSRVSIPAVQLELPALLRALVTVGTSEGKPVVAHRAPRQAIAATPARTVLLDALIKARLVVTDSSPDGTPTVSLAHGRCCGTGSG